MEDVRNPNHIKQLDADIEELENAIYGKEEDKTNQATSAHDEEELEENEVETEETEVSVEPTEVEFDSAEEVAEVPPEVEEERKPKRTNWKRKFQESDTRYRKYRATTDKTIFELRQQNTSLTQTIEDLHDKVDVLSKHLGTAAAQDNSVDVSSMFSEEDRDVLGDTAINSLSKVAKQMVDAEMAPIRDREEKRAEMEKQRRKEQAEFNQREIARSFERKLGEVVPNYEDIDKDPQFLEYLNDTDLTSGYTRMQLFKKAQNNGDVKRVADFFLEFDGIRKGPETTLERKITPTGRGAVGAPVQSDAGGEVEMIPFSIIDEFHDSITNGSFTGTREDIEVLDKRFDRAYNDGRIDFSR